MALTRPLLKAERPPQPGASPHSELYGTGLALIALTVEFREGLDFGTLSSNEAATAIRVLLEEDRLELAPDHFLREDLVRVQKKFSGMGPGVFLAPDADEPEGSFLFMDAGLRMSFPTQTGKLYILDCRVMPIANALQVKIQRKGAPDVSVPEADGHILHVFTAKEMSTELALKFVPPENFPASAYFYGCDFGKAN